MDWYPLWNSLRIAAVSSVLVFFSGIGAAYYAAKLPRLLKGFLDVFLTLPMVLPPTVVGYFLLLLVGNRRPLGMALENLGLQLVMDWKGGILAAFAVSFPLMYRTARGAFESFDETLAQAGKTLGLSNAFIFWRIRMPVCRSRFSLRQGPGRIRSHQHADRLHSRKNRHHLHHRLSDVENRRRPPGLFMGFRQPGYLCSRAAGCKRPGAERQTEKERSACC